jgi:hypothetical protein
MRMRRDLCSPRHLACRVLMNGVVKIICKFILKSTRVFFHYPYLVVADCTAYYKTQVVCVAFTKTINLEIVITRNYKTRTCVCLGLPTCE